MVKYKKISIIIVTWNNEKKLPVCLKYISKQDYPEDKLEVIIVDGGSQDNTLIIAEKFKKTHNLKIIKTNIRDPEQKRAIGVLEAKGDYICVVDPDVYLTHRNWLKEMISPLESDATLTGSQTLYYEYNKNESLINRYFALFGFNDPVAFYLKKADRIPHFESKWLFNTNFIDKKSYFEVTFDKDIPTMGSNGAVFRKGHYLKADLKPVNYFHIDAIQDMINKGYKKYAIVKNSVLHSTSSSLWGSIKRRIWYMRTHYFTKNNKRRYLVYNSKITKDKINLAKFIFFTLTIWQPLYLSIKGYLKIPDLAWFLHLPMCFVFFFAYAYAVIIKAFQIDGAN